MPSLSDLNPKSLPYLQEQPKVWHYLLAWAFWQALLGDTSTAMQAGKCFNIQEWSKCQFLHVCLPAKCNPCFGPLKRSYYMCVTAEIKNGNIKQSRTWCYTSYLRPGVKCVVSLGLSLDCSGCCRSAGADQRSVQAWPVELFSLDCWWICSHTRNIQDCIL